MKQVEIFTSGACKGNPGPGGWAAILRMGAHEKSLSGGEPGTTVNRMELSAALHGLLALIEPCEVTLNTHSRFVVDGIAKWMPGWTRSGWISVSKRPIHNADLWHALIGVIQLHQMRWELVTGMNAAPEIERAENLASAAVHTE